jgi:hypothetical protein
MEDKNYSCPVCKGKLLVTQEHGFDKEQLINPKTGIPQKKVKTRHWGPIDTPTILKCSNHNCDFEYFPGDGDKFFGELFDIILDSEHFKCNE